VKKTLPSLRKACNMGVVKQKADAGRDSATYVSSGVILLKNLSIVC
jgi:hypothetical protein